MPLQATSGAASYDAFGGGVPVEPVYIESIFQTWLYTGNGSTQTITNGIDLAGKGGLVWQKNRSAAGYDHVLTDTTTSGTGALTKFLSSNTTNGFPANEGNIIGSYNSDGFTLNSGSGYSNNNGVTAVSWTFRKQPKFFDVVTYTGDGTTPRNISHNLGSVPGCVIVKMLTDNGYSWQVYHRGLTSAAYRVELDTTGAETTSLNPWVSTAPTASVFTVSNSLFVNGSGKQYVAYLFASNAGGFGLTGTDNVISCGSFTTAASGYSSINLGYEPQWVLIKTTGVSQRWYIFDNMRGFPVTGNSPALSPNLADAEDTSITDAIRPTATGFEINADYFGGSRAYIYIAIRRGPMKVPADATKVFEPLTRSGTGGATTVTSTVRPDTVLQNWRSGGLGSASHFMYDRLRGVAKALFTDATDAESTQTATGINAFNNLSYGIAGAGSMNNGSALYADYVFTRAPGFFDEVCFTQTTTSGAQAIAHNLTVAPELVIVKPRSQASSSWEVFPVASNNRLNLNAASAASTYAPLSSVTSTSFSYPMADIGWSIGVTYVAYLFATVAGVSKVGGYTGNGTTQAIACGFTGGARFVLIKRTDSSGDWYVWDSARGIVAGNDPHLSLNTTAAEVTTDDSVDTDSTGFVVNQVAATNINVSSATYVFLAVA